MAEQDVVARYTPRALVGVSVIGAIVFGVVAVQRPLTALENVLLQMFTFAVGLVGSYVWGRQSARSAAREMITPHARSAFRRLLSLYGSLSRLANAIANSRPDPQAAFVSSVVLDKLEAIVVEQIKTADDALEDWSDLVPDDVAEVRRRVADRKAAENQT
jgi:hypothetical protein